jgi:DNA invertase Pin-like site-specific DNA recombinase
LDDQIATARRYADAHRWTFLENQVYTDAAVSGASLDRPGIQALRAAASMRPRPFDVLLVDDSSRVSRDLADAVRLLQELKFSGIRVIYISQAIDSASEQAETLVAVHGVVDSLYLREMSKKVKRGLAGQLERGFATGSSTFGYRTVPVADPSGKKDTNGYPVLLGKRVEIEPTEARVVIQIYEWFATGLGVRRIVDRLNAENVEGPRGHRWRHGAVRRILSNEKYTGKRIWGQRRTEREPGTHRRVARPVPRDAWHVQERADLRIVEQGLWDRVQQRHAAILTALPTTGGARPTLMRGRHAKLFSRYLFSGFMRCAVCGGNVTVIHGGNGSPRYGCSRSDRHGDSTCTNRLTMRASLADARLLAGLQFELLQPATIRYVSDAMTAELIRRTDDRPALEAEAKAAREQARGRLQRLITAIESGVPAPSLLAAIAEREADLARLDAQLAELAEPSHRALAVIPSWVEGQIRDLAGLLNETTERAKLEFQRLGLVVTMDPIRDEGDRPFYRATVQAALPALAGTRDLSSAVVDRLSR